MKTLPCATFIILLILMFGCKPQHNTREMDQELINNEVKEQFSQLTSALSNLDTLAWSGFYSHDEFISAFVGTDFYGNRSEFVNIIESYFSGREYQHVEPIEVQVTALAQELALMTSREKTEMRLNSGEEIKSVHVFTMIWKKGPDGWNIIHSNESWINE